MQVLPDNLIKQYNFHIIKRVIILSGQTRDYENIYLSGNLEEDILLFRNIFKKDAILRIKRLKIQNEREFEAALVYMDGMIDAEQLNESVIRPLLTVDFKSDSELADYVSDQILFVRDVKKKSELSCLLEGMLYGETVILLEGSPTALLVDCKGWRTRGIKEPEDERVLQGPREGFDEAAMLNLAMLRRKLQTPDLAVELLRVGRRSNTIVFICYLDSLADSRTVEKVKSRIKKIDIDGILDSNYITELIRDEKYSLFKTSGSTERPDIVAARLLEGRIAIMVDGSPVVVTIPYLFSENFQSDEDYYLNFYVSSVGRVLRYLCFFLSISLPAIFIAISTFHRELLPTSLAIAVAELRGGVPFPPLTECLILILVFEILKETGVRMPQSLGHALSIVGGLVVGQAAVEAKIISTPMLIVIALSGIAGLMIPRLKGAVIYLRVGLVILSALFGLFGYITGITIVIMHIISLTSFGVDYTLSLRKANFQSLKDTVIRSPWPFMKTRPRFNSNKVRQKEKK